MTRQEQDKIVMVSPSDMAKCSSMIHRGTDPTDCHVLAQHVHTMDRLTIWLTDMVAIYAI